MAEIAASPIDNKGNGDRTKNRRSTRVDLTPMVDLGFLLITFFVFTTSMSEAKVMVLNEPKDGLPMHVKASGAMTILLSKDHSIYYYYKELNKSHNSFELKRTSFKEVRGLILDMKNRTYIDNLMYIIKADEDATFGDAVNLLDEMIVCAVPPGHFVEVDMTEEERRMTAARPTTDDLPPKH